MSTPKVKAEIKILGRTFSASGSTVAKAIEKLNPEVTKGRGILTITKENKSKERILAPAIVNRIFGINPPLVREVAIRNIANLFE